MPDIYIPSQLQRLETGSELLSLFKALSEPEAKRKVDEDIKNDIIKYHALNDAEAQKYQNAMSTIAQNQALLDSAKNISAQNEKDSYQLRKDQEKFEAYKKEEGARLAKERENNASDLIKNQGLYDKSVEAQNDVTAREKLLTDTQTIHTQNVKEFEVGVAKLTQSQKDLDELKAKVAEELKNITIKKEALKQLVNN